MNNQSNKLSVGLAIFFELVVFETSIVSIATRQWKNFALTLLAMVCLILPFIISRISISKKIVLPSSFQIITLIFVFFAQYLGEIKKFYQIVWWWDLLLHAIFGSYVVIIAFYLIKGIVKKKKETTKRRFLLFAAVFAFSLSIALGTLWEMFEFIGDYLFKTHMIKGGLEDTSTDLIAKISAALITSITYYHRSLKNDNSFS